MDYEEALNFVRDQRLDLAEERKELRNKIMETIAYLTNYQDFVQVIQKYVSVEVNVVNTMAFIDNLEKKLIEAFR